MEAAILNSADALRQKGTQSEKQRATRVLVTVSRVAVLIDSYARHEAPQCIVTIAPILLLYGSGREITASHIAIATGANENIRVASITLLISKESTADGNAPKVTGLFTLLSGKTAPLGCVPRPGKRLRAKSP